MRGLLAILLLANVLALAWWQGWIGAWMSSAGRPASATAEIAPERLRVVPSERLRTAASSGAEAGAPIPAAGPASGDDDAAPRPPGDPVTR